MCDNKNTEKVTQGGFTYLINRKEGTAWIADGDTGGSRTFTLPEKIVIEGREYVCESVEIGAFSGERELVELYVPDTYKYIDEDSFHSCEKLSKVHIGKGLEYYSKWTFPGCPVEVLTIDPENPHLRVSADGRMVLSADGRSVLSTLWRLSVPQLIVQEGVESIGEGGISCCESLKSLSLPSSLRRIGPNGIFELAALKELKIPEGVIEIGHQGISFNESLEELDLPVTCRELGYEMLDGDSSLKRLILRADSVVETHSEDYVRRGVFDRIPAARCVLEVPQHLVDAYRNHPDWGRFAAVRGLEPHRPCIVAKKGDVIYCQGGKTIRTGRVALDDISEFSGTDGVIPFQQSYVERLEDDFTSDIRAYRTFSDRELPFSDCMGQFDELPVNSVNPLHYVLLVRVSRNFQVLAGDLRAIRCWFEDIESGILSLKVSIVYGDNLPEGAVEMLLVTYSYEDGWPEAYEFFWDEEDCDSLSLEQLKTELMKIRRKVRRGVGKEYQEEVLARHMNFVIPEMRFSEKRSWRETLRVLEYFKGMGADFRRSTCRMLSDIVCCNGRWPSLAATRFACRRVIWAFRNGAEPNIVEGGVSPLDIVENALRRLENEGGRVRMKVKCLKELKCEMAEQGCKTRNEIRASSSMTDFDGELKTLLLMTGENDGRLL